MALEVVTRAPNCERVDFLLQILSLDGQYAYSKTGVLHYEDTIRGIAPTASRFIKVEGHSSVAPVAMSDGNA